jgi:iron complex transport system ATP-binding protein
VQDVVAMGLYPFAGKIPAETEAAQCKTAMEAMDIYPLRHRVYQTLSGGEAQKVQMSRVLAQIGDANRQHKLLLLDEPVSHLDIKYQHQLLRAARRLCADGVTVVAVLHDLNLALAYAHRLLLLHQGRLAFDLSQPESITPEMVYSVFGIDACLIKREGLPPVVCFG